MTDYKTLLTNSGGDHGQAMNPFAVDELGNIKVQDIEEKELPEERKTPSKFEDDSSS